MRSLFKSDQIFNLLGNRCECCIVWIPCSQPITFLFPNVKKIQSLAHGLATIFI